MTPLMTAYLIGAWFSFLFGLWLDHVTPEMRRSRKPPRYLLLLVWTFLYPAVIPWFLLLAWRHIGRELHQRARVAARQEIAVSLDWLRPVAEFMGPDSPSAEMVRDGDLLLAGRREECKYIKDEIEFVRWMRQLKAEFPEHQDRLPIPPRS